MSRATLIALTQRCTMIAKLWSAVVYAANVYNQTPTADNLARLRAAELAYKLEIEANMI